MITQTHFLVLSAALFMLGVVGVMTRRNIIIILMSMELMLNAVNINLIAFSRQLGDVTGQVFAVFVIWGLAAAYFCVPRAAGRRLWSNRLATWTYWLEILGFATMFAVLSVSGLQQGAMLQSGQKRLVVFMGGFPEWSAAGYPVATGAGPGQEP